MATTDGVDDTEGEVLVLIDEAYSTSVVLDVEVDDQKRTVEDAVQQRCHCARTAATEASQSTSAITCAGKTMTAPD